MWGRGPSHAEPEAGGAGWARCLGSGLCPVSVTLDKALPPLALSFHVWAVWVDQVTSDETISI